MFPGLKTVSLIVSNSDEKCQDWALYSGGEHFSPIVRASWTVVPNAVTRERAAPRPCHCQAWHSQLRSSPACTGRMSQDWPTPKSPPCPRFNPFQFVRRARRNVPLSAVGHAMRLAGELHRPLASRMTPSLTHDVTTPTICVWKNGRSRCSYQISHLLTD